MCTCRTMVHHPVVVAHLLEEKIHSWREKEKIRKERGEAQKALAFIKNPFLKKIIFEIPLWTAFRTRHLFCIDFESLFSPFKVFGALIERRIRWCYDRKVSKAKLFSNHFPIVFIFSLEIWTLDSGSILDRCFIECLIIFDSLVFCFPLGNRNLDKIKRTLIVAWQHVTLCVTLIN